MQKSIQPKVLMDEEGIQITTRQVTTPLGDFPLKDIEDIASRTTRPLWGPLLLGILGTVNLAIAFQSTFWLDFAASGLMLGAGLYWWTQGTKYVLTLTSSTGPVDAWITHHESQLRQALDILRQRLEKSRASGKT